MKPLQMEHLVDPLFRTDYSGSFCGWTLSFEGTKHITNSCARICGIILYKETFICWLFTDDVALLDNRPKGFLHVAEVVQPLKICRSLW